MKVCKTIYLQYHTGKIKVYNFAELGVSTIGNGVSFYASYFGSLMNVPPTALRFTSHRLQY